MTKFWFSAVAAFSLSVGPAFAQDTTSQEDPQLACEMLGSNGIVTGLLCPVGLTDEELAVEGRAVCDLRDDCGAWIWTDRDMAPSELPDDHRKLTKEQVLSALGVWVQGRDSLIRLRDE